MFCRTKAGTQRLYWEGVEYQLDSVGLDLPADLAENIRPHVNIVVEDAPAPPEPAPSPKKAKRSDPA